MNLEDGVHYRLFCAGERCVNDVVGDIIFETPDGEIEAPVCEFHAAAVQEDPEHGLEREAE